MKTFFFLLSGFLFVQAGLQAHPSLQSTIQHREAVKKQQALNQLKKKSTQKKTNIPVVKREINLKEEGKEIRLSDIYFEKTEGTLLLKK